MSIEVMTWAFRQKVASPTAKLVLIALADHANADGECWPSMGRVAEIAEISPRSVSRHVTTLEELGLVEKVKRRRQNGHLGSWVYRVLYRTEMTGRSDSPTGQERSVLPVTGVRTEPSENRQGEPLPSGKNERPRNLLFDSVVDVCGYGDRKLTKNESGRVAVAVKQLKDVGATPEEVNLRAESYLKMWPGMTLTPTALASNWSLLEPKHRVESTCRDCGQRMKNHDDEICQLVGRN